MKRGHHEGTIYKRPNGTWAAQIMIAGRRRTKYAPTRRACQAWLTEQRAALDQGRSLEPVRVTVADYLTHWLEIGQPTWAPSTHKHYAQVVRDHLVPEIGSVQLQRLRPDHVQVLLSRKLQAGTGTRTVQLAHAVLRRALNQARRWGLITTNPAEVIDAPRPPRHEMSVWDANQVRRFLEACADHRLHALFYLAVTAGIRQGELLGLQWSDFDAATGTLQIQRQIRRVHGEGLQLRDVKTAAGRRLITLGETGIAKLRAHRKDQIEEQLFAGAQWNNAHDLIFTNTIGGPVDPSKLYKQFRAISARAGLPQIRFHDLRHTAASLMLSQGIHPKVVQERLGHSTISITLDTYSHVVPSLQRDAAELIDALVS